MTPEQRLEQAVRFMEYCTRQSFPGSEMYDLAWWCASKDLNPEDAEAIRGYVARLMAGEDPDQMIVTNLEQTGEAA